MKTAIVYGMTALNEASYGAGGSPSAATDGIQLAEPAVAQISYTFDGQRERPGGTAGTQRRAQPGGRHIIAPLSIVGRGAGAAYSATVFPEGHRFLLACGLDATLVATGGSESWTYTPTPLTGTFDSLVANLYARGQLWPVTGGYGTFGFNIDGPSFARFTGELSGIVGHPTDVALPAITYSTLMPPKAEGTSFNIGNYTAGIVRRVEFSMNRQRETRENITVAGGFSGFVPGYREPTLTVELEADALHTATPWHAAAALNPYRLYADGEQFSVSFTLGSVQYNRFTFTAAQAQLAAAPEEIAFGTTAGWRLQFALNCSTGAADDDFSLVFN